MPEEKSLRRDSFDLWLNTSSNVEIQALVLWQKENEKPLVLLQEALPIYF